MTKNKAKQPQAGEAEADGSPNASAARYRALMEHANDAIIMGDVERRVIIDVNRRACELLGRSREELIGMPVMDMHPPELHQRYSELFGEHVAAGGSTSVELVLRHCDGSDIPVSVSVAVVEVEGHRLIQGIFRDIRELKQTDARLRQEAAFRESLIESAAEGIGLWQRIEAYPFVRFTVWNQRMQEITGYSMQQINDLGWYQTLYRSPEAQASAQERMAMVEAGGKVRGLETRIITQSGDERMLRISSAPVTVEGGQTLVLAVMEDITEQRDLEANMRQMQKIEALGTLVGGIAHDFNNILTGMLGNIYLAQTDAELPPEVAENLAVAEELGYRAADLISQLMTFARKGRVNMQGLELNSCLRQAFDRRLLMVPESIRLIREFVDGPLPVFADVAQIEQVMMNLLNNARDALDGCRDPMITVRLERFVPDARFKRAHQGDIARAYARISVEDNGQGIAPQHLERIFEPFYTTKDVGSGTGLGLATTYSIVQRHGGLIEVDSAEGKGTVFRIYLPLSDDKQATMVAPGTPVSGHGELILLADDEPDVLHSVAEVIERLGYRVLAASDGEQALTLFRSHRDDVALAILDVVMPGISGTETAQRMREERPGLPIIFATGYNIGGDLMHAVNKRFRVLAKPFRIDDLGREIRGLLDPAGPDPLRPSPPAGI